MNGSTGKLAGKTEWAGRRRPATRRAGYNATARVQIAQERIDAYRLNEASRVEVSFEVPQLLNGAWGGFGGWFAATPGIRVDLQWGGRRVLTEFSYPSWNKVGSLYPGPIGASQAVLTFTAEQPGTVTMYDMLAGGVQHDYIDNARPNLLKNMWSFAPEANFYDPTRPGSVTIKDSGLQWVAGDLLVIKSCNRCGRFLPVNLTDERNHLSFSNHCVADHRRPCRHPSFGRIQDRDGGPNLQLDYGFQLECRFCKKFEVNAAHNPQRTAGQMKEDAARRRHFELLLEYLYGGSPQLRYKNETGRDLASDIYRRFDGRCFKCGTALADERSMHLDHTRPLALLWPLDGTATALCSTHNSDKRDRPPVEYYSEDELSRLSILTGVSLRELQDPSPNMDAIERLGKNLDWLHDDFLQRPELQKVRDGKLTADLVVKALEKVLARVPGGPPFEL